MGDGIEIKCSSCDFKKTFFIGVGMSPLTIENSDEFLNEYNKGILHHIKQNHRINSQEVGEYRLFRCHKCGFLKDNIYFKITYNKDNTFTAIYNCPRCKTQMGSTIPEIVINKHHCPSCKNNTLLIDYTILWD